MSKSHNRYADKFKYNASLQLDLLHRAIALYSENLEQKIRLSKYVDRVKMELGDSINEYTKEENSLKP